MIWPRFRRMGLEAMVAAATLLVLSQPGYALYVAKGATLTRLTQDGRSAMASAGLERIAFYRLVTGGRRQLMTSLPDGRDAKPASPVGYPYTESWAPDGRRIAYLYADSSEEAAQANIWIAEVATAQNRPLTRGYRNSTFSDDEPPVWSPDGRFISIKIHPTALRETWTFPTDGSPGRRLLAQLPQARNPSWIADSAAVVMLGIETDGSDGIRNVWRENPRGGGVQRLTNLGSGTVSRPTASPGGRWVAFISNAPFTPAEREKGYSDFCLVRDDGAALYNLTQQAPARSSVGMSFDNFGWSPDGKTIFIMAWAWERGRTGQRQVFYLADAEARSLTSLMETEPLGTPKRTVYTDPPWDYATHREWSPDSTRVLLKGRRYAVDATGAATELASDQRQMIGYYDVVARAYHEVLELRPSSDRLQLSGDLAWTPDGKAILCSLAKIVSADSGINEPDLYRIDLAPSVAPSSPAVTAEPTPTPQPAPAVPAVTGDTSQPAAQEITTIFAPAYIRAERAIEALPKRYAELITVDKSHNTLVFRGPAAVASELVATLPLVDKPVSQISTQVLVCELSRSASRQLGLDWGWARGRFGALLPLGEGFITQGTDADGNPIALAGGSGVGEIVYQGVGRLDRQFFVNLQALEASGQVQIQAAPTVLCRNGEQAKINVRRVTNFLFTQGFDAAGRPIVGKSDISADITLAITPTVTSSGLIILDTEATVGNFIFKLGSSLPDVTTREAQTTLALRDGETLLIGGLKQTETESSMSKTPLLGDLPLIGSLFRKTHRGTRESILTVLITPHVVQPSDVTPGSS